MNGASLMERAVTFVSRFVMLRELTMNKYDIKNAKHLLSHIAQGNKVSFQLKKEDWHYYHTTKIEVSYSASIVITEGAELKCFTSTSTYSYSNAAKLVLKEYKDYVEANMEANQTLRSKCNDCAGGCSC
jgi:hypothetical protein